MLKGEPINIYIEITPQEQHELIHHKIPAAALKPPHLPRKHLSNEKPANEMYYSRDLSSSRLNQHQQQMQSRRATNYQHSYSMIEKAHHHHHRSSSVDRKRLKFIYGQETPSIGRTGSISTVPFSSALTNR